MKILAHSENAFSASLLMATSLLISPASSASLLLTCNKANTSSKEPIVTPPLPCTLYLRLCGRASALVRQQHLKNYPSNCTFPSHDVATLNRIAMPTTQTTTLHVGVRELLWHTPTNQQRRLHKPLPPTAALSTTTRTLAGRRVYHVE